MVRIMSRSIWAIFLLTLIISACSNDSSSKKQFPKPAINNAGINLPDGFGAIITADTLGRGRHIAVNENGDLYVKLRKMKNGHGVLALRDSDGDGIMDLEKGFMPYGGSGIAIHNGYIYCSSDSVIYRYKLKQDELVPSSNPELIATGFPKQGPHATKPLTFDNEGHMYVAVGAPVNAGEEKAFSKESPGIDPSPFIVRQAGIWRFDDSKPNQTQNEAYHYATGIRNGLAMDWNMETNALYAVSHGRDQLGGFWPEVYNSRQNADLPAEQFIKINKDQDYGWPYCYYDQYQNKQILSPEFGGDGNKTERCDGIESPLIALPAHTAPNDLLFYTGNMFPNKYKNGAFVALHGSWNRAPFPQMGYSVVFIPFNGGQPTGDYEEFATGFAGKDEIMAPNEAKYRPMGIAQGPDGSLFIIDSVVGRVWRIYYYN